MSERGDELRSATERPPKLVAGSPFPRPLPSLLDWAFLNAHDFEAVSKLNLTLTKEDTRRRLQVLRREAKKWANTWGKAHIIERWERRVLSDFGLSKDQIVSNSGIDNFGTLFFEFYWRLIHGGPKEAFALIGANTSRRTSLRTYSLKGRVTQKKASRRSLKKRRVGNDITNTEAFMTMTGWPSHRPQGPMSLNGPHHANFNVNSLHREQGPSTRKMDPGYYPRIDRRQQPMQNGRPRLTWQHTPNYSREHGGAPDVPHQHPSWANPHNPHPTGNTRRYYGQYGRHAPQQDVPAGQHQNNRTHNTQNPVQSTAQSASFVHPFHRSRRSVNSALLPHDGANTEKRQQGPTPPSSAPGHLPRLTNSDHHGGTSKYAADTPREQSHWSRSDRPHSRPPHREDPSVRLARAKEERQAKERKDAAEAKLRHLDEQEKERLAQEGLRAAQQAPMARQAAPRTLKDSNALRTISKAKLPKFTKIKQVQPPAAVEKQPTSPSPSHPSSLAPTESKTLENVAPVDRVPMLPQRTLRSSSQKRKRSESPIPGLGRLSPPRPPPASPPAFQPSDSASPGSSATVAETVDSLLDDDSSMVFSSSQTTVVDDSEAIEETEPKGERCLEKPDLMEVDKPFVPPPAPPPPLDMDFDNLADTDITLDVNPDVVPLLPMDDSDESLLAVNDDLSDEEIEKTIQSTFEVQSPRLLTPPTTHFDYNTPVLDTLAVPSNFPQPAFTMDQELPQLDLPFYRPAPPLRTYPPIWAETRQEVCESFEWFRSYQGGVYFSNDIVKGYLLGAFGAKRDVFKHDGRLIISHGGGRAESMHSEKGQHVVRPAEDQRSDDKSVRALLKTFSERRPVALIIDDRYAKFPYDLAAKGVAYAVLGFYMIVDAWAEIQPDDKSQRDIVKYKFAFQWCEGQGDPWWTSESGKAHSHDLDENAPPGKVDEERDVRKKKPTAIVSRECSRCLNTSPQVFAQGWACLQPACHKFWRVQEETSSDASSGTLDVPDVKSEDPPTFLPEQLTYHKDFLGLREPCPLPIGFETLSPTPVQVRNDGVTTSRAFTRGFHCEECGRLSCRVEWRRWRCSTPGCKTERVVKAKIRDAQEFLSQPISPRYLTANIDPRSDVIQQATRTFYDDKGGLVGIVDTFVLPEGRGFLHHIQSTSAPAKAHADDIFNLYQEEANDGSLVFKRWPMRAHKCRGALLTNYFSHNAGEPYHYVGGTDNTVPFDKAPKAVVDARAMIQLRISQALGRPAEFNEVLTAAYMEKQKMAFHSDEEVGLGPLVATLSLGSPALMHFRLQRKHDRDQQNKGILMSFILRHGDVFVMDGLAVQKFYDHTVVPTNFRIAATARSIHAPPPRPAVPAPGLPPPFQLNSSSVPNKDANSKITVARPIQIKPEPRQHTPNLVWMPPALPVERTALPPGPHRLSTLTAPAA